MRLSTIFGWCSRLFSRIPATDTSVPILPFPRGSSEDPENTICALRQQLRDRSRMANEGFAAAAMAKHERDEAEANLGIAKEQLVKCDRLIHRLEKEIGWRKRANGRLAQTCRQYRDLLKEFERELDGSIAEMKSALTLESLDGPIDIMAPAIRAGIVLRDERGVRAGLAVCSESRLLVGKIFARVLPAIFVDVQGADAQAKAKS